MPDHDAPFRWMMCAVILASAWAGHLPVALFGLACLVNMLPREKP